MENSTKKSGCVEIPKRKRSLDLKSLYESRVSKVGESKKKVCDENDQDDVKTKKRKSRKEVSLSCLESDAKKSRKEDVNGSKSELGTSQKSSSGSKGFQDISLALANNGSAFSIPKRPRGSVGQKKTGGDQVSESSGLAKSVESVDRVGALAKVIKSEEKGGPVESSTPVVTLSAGNGGVSNSKSVRKVSGSNLKSKQKAESKSTGNSSSLNVKLKVKAEAAEVKETKNGRSGSVRHAVKECNPVVNNGDASSKKRGSNSKKKKNTVVGVDVGESSSKKSEPSVGSSVSDSLCTDSLDDDDDDEENLEQNAARMLSSRFDPSCTGFSSKRKSAVSQTANGFSFPVLSGRGSFNREANSLGDRESASVDDRSRALRPRREDKGKGLSRKRRHFYEILPRDLDAYWVLNRRIKIFWPLDDTWYYGLVHEYHSESKLHHIKYDDRDEEWVDLQEEKFKLLLLPSEVPGKAKSKRRSTGGKEVHMEETVPPAEDDSYLGNYLDSEPIASWLASSSQRAKALPKSLKRRRTSQTHLPSVSTLPSEKTDNSNCNVTDLKRTRNKSDCKSASNDNSVVCRTSDKSLTVNTTSSNNDKQAVYVRRKYRKKSGGSNSVSREDVKACQSAPRAATPLSPVPVGLWTTKEGISIYGSVDSNKQPWLIDGTGKLRFNDSLLESIELSFQICLPSLLLVEFLYGKEYFGLLHDIFMLRHGVVTITSPAVVLELLFVDTTLGVRFLLFEGCMKEALAFVFLILVVFGQSDEHWNSDMKLPVTSIRFRLSSVQNLRKQHVFSVYSFSRLQSSKWLYLDSKILQHCLLVKRLSVSECTYDNIKELQCAGFQQSKLCIDLEPSSNEGFTKKLLPGILPIGISREASNRRMIQSAKPGNASLSFTSAPTFFLTLHLQLLMEHSNACVNLQRQDAHCSPEVSENVGLPVAGSVQTEFSSVEVQDVPAEHEVGLLGPEASSCRGLSIPEQDSRMDVVLASNVVGKADSFEKSQDGNPDEAGTAGRFKKFTEIPFEVIAQPHQHESKKEVHEQIIASAPPSELKSFTSPTPNPRSDPTSGAMLVDVPSFDQVDMSFDGKGCISRPTSDVGGWKRGRSSSIYSPLGHHSPVWPDGKPSFMPNGFGDGPKKPRTQVQYTLPFAGYDLSEKQQMQNQRSPPCKRIRRASVKRISDGSTNNNQKNLELLACVGNVLITHGDKGWRECGANIVLEAADHNEWRLAVKLSGATKYSYKVKHILQPGSTNRYTHAMMWKGGKDWVLEFPDRGQWVLFKEMHEECFNRNIRAASVKNIPIPGVRLVEESDEYGTAVPFVRNPLKYYRQVQTDVEMAMDASHILYDMDSDDEQWLMANKSTEKHKCEEISEEFLEKIIDMFEKVSYVRLRDNFTDAEIEEMVTGIGSVEAAKLIYGHWRQKRETKGMPLIRHLQRPLWERYQNQLKEWERAVPRGNFAFSGASQAKVPPPEKPQMFAFCLKPRGLEVPSRGSKQRSHRKFPVSGPHHHLSGNHDSLHAFGRRPNGHAFGDEKMLYPNSIHYSPDFSPSLQASSKRVVLSPRDSHFSLSTDYKNRGKKLGSYPYSQNQQMRQGVPEWRLDGSDLQEFRLRDAAGAARHARNMAKLKREKAQRLLYRADLAIHRAVVAIMTADAIKDSCGNPNGKNNKE